MLTALPSLAFVLALAALAGLAVRRLGWRPPMPATGAITIVSRTRLDGRRTLYQIRHHGRGILLLAGGGADLVVDRWDDPPEAAS